MDQASSVSPQQPASPSDATPDGLLTPKLPSKTVSQLPDVDLAGKPILVMEFKGLVTCSDHPRSSRARSPTFNTTIDNDTNMNYEHSSSGTPDEHASHREETLNEDELSDDAPPIDGVGPPYSQDTSLPLSRRPRKAAKFAALLDFFIKSLLKTYPRLKLDIERWKEGIGHNRKAAIVKSSVNQVPWKLSLLFEQNGELLTERTQKILHGLENTQRNVKGSDQGSGGREFLQRLWFDFQKIGESMDEAITTLEDLTKCIEFYEEWQDEYIVELLEKHLITPESPENQSLPFQLVYLTNECTKRCLEDLGVFVRSMEELKHCLLCFLKLFKRQKRSLELWKHFVTEDQVNLHRVSQWMTYWIEVLNCILKAFDSLSNLAKSLSRFS